MLPINDFNFVVAGIATFAATVGYACTRRLSASLCVSVAPYSGLRELTCRCSVGSDSDAIRDSIRNQSKVHVEHHQAQMADESVLIVEKSVDVRSSQARRTGLRFQPTEQRESEEEKPS
jgi:hypothetical protein